jgi:hypothetical protein
MLDTVGNNDELAFPRAEILIAQADCQLAFDYHEKLVFGFVIVPDKIALQLDQLDVAVVEFANDLGMPTLLEQGEFLGRIDYLNIRHRGSSSS